MLHHGPCHLLTALAGRRISAGSDGFIFQGCINVAVAIGGFSAHGHKQPAGFYAARIVVQAGDVRVTASGSDACAAQQLCETHEAIINIARSPLNRKEKPGTQRSRATTKSKDHHGGTETRRYTEIHGESYRQMGRQRSDKVETSNVDFSQ